jgi:hypothetical protein
MQDGATNTEAMSRNRGKMSLRGYSRLCEADAIKGQCVFTVHVHAQGTKSRDSFRHDAFAAGLVNRRPRLICDKDLEATLAGSDRRSEPDGTATHNDNIRRHLLTYHRSTINSRHNPGLGTIQSSFLICTLF